MSVFENSKLMISARSPFARRVRIALREHNIKYEEAIFNVFDSNPLLNKHNPLRRVPVIVLQSGEEIADSSYILNTLYEEQRNSPFVPQLIAQKIVCANWSGLAVGLCEMIVQYFIESQKMVAMQDAVLMKEIREIIGETLKKYESFLGNKEYCIGQQLTQTDFDWGVALFYLQLRIPSKFEQQFPKLNQYIMRLNERDSFRGTTPPPA